MESNYLAQLAKTLKLPISREELKILLIQTSDDIEKIETSKEFSIDYQLYCAYRYRKELLLNQKLKHQKQLNLLFEILKEIEIDVGDVSVLANYYNLWLQRQIILYIFQS
jgi:hypothetical protein